MTELRQRMTEDMRLRGLSEATQRTYLDAIANLARHFKRSPDLLTDEELRIVREVCTWADPCNMHLAHILTAAPAPIPGAEWILGSAGYSEVGLTTVLT